MNVSGLFLAAWPKRCAAKSEVMADGGAVELELMSTEKCDDTETVTGSGLNIRSTSIIDTSYFYFGLVLGRIDADLCK